MLALIRLMFMLPRAEAAKDELRDLAHGTDGRGVGFAGDAACDQGQEEGQHDRNRALPIGHVQSDVRQHGQRDQRNELSGKEPRHRRFDFVHFADGVAPLAAKTSCRDCRTPAATLRHCKTKESSPEVTMHDTPPQRVHGTMSEIVDP